MWTVRVDSSFLSPSLMGREASLSKSQLWTRLYHDSETYSINFTRVETMKGVKTGVCISKPP